MSENNTDTKQLSEQLARTRKVASVAITIALIAAAWVITAIIVNQNQANSIQDLQRRIAVLEQEKRPPNRLPKIGEIHWCQDCAVGDPCGRGIGAWLGRMEDGRFVCK
jgi:hypothetical protein